MYVIDFNTTSGVGQTKRSRSWLYTDEWSAVVRQGCWRRAGAITEDSFVRPATGCEILCAAANCEPIFGVGWGG